MSGTGANTDIQGWGMIKRFIMTAQKLTNEGGNIINRMGPYGEQVIETTGAKQHKLADEGSYYITRTATIGTGIPTIAALSGYADANPFILISNLNPIGGRAIYLDYIKLLLTVAGTNGVGWQFATKYDTIIRVSAGGGYGGNGTGLTNTLQGPVVTNTGASPSSAALIYAGALATVTASSLNARLLQNGILRTAIGVVNDQYFFNFGGCDMSLDGVLTSGTAIAQKNVAHPPICIGPQHSFTMHVWAPSQTVASNFEIEIGHVER